MSAKQLVTRRIPARYVALLCDVITSHGIRPYPLLTKVGLPIASVEDRDAWFCATKCEQFIADAIQTTGRTDLACDLGSKIKFTSHDLLGLGMISASSLHEMMRMLSRHFHLIHEQFVCRYVRNADFGEIYYTPVCAIPQNVLHFYYELIASSHYSQILFATGDDTPYDIYLPIPKPSHGHRYEPLKAARFHFNAQGTPGVRIVMNASILDKELPFADQRLHKEVEGKCEAMAIKPISSQIDLGEYLRMMLKESIGERITLSDLALRLKTSPRTIERYLIKQNLNFRQLAEEVRFERACELLLQPQLSIDQVAKTLGFDYPANFSRSFKRVMGFTPSEYQSQRRDCTDQAA